MGENFHKYEQRGAYHWGFVSNHPFRHHCPTTARYKAVLNALPDWQGRRVVDVGCGDGALSGWLVKEGARVTGVEPEDDGRALAQGEFAKRGLGGTFISNLADLPPNAFDVAVCSDVIEHVPDPLGLLADIRRVVKPGGMVVITTPVRLTETPLDPHHVTEFFPSEFLELMEQQFVRVELSLEIPIAGLMLYYWRPWFFLRRPVVTWFCNLLEILTGINLVEGITALDRYHHLQVATGFKEST
ncbi:MAG: class I SAM-dependent methyltransferase [Magnetococcales bacterium]|nr:class I SAM-dependent methyltransferase [Magnetococcales bacterium]